MLSYMNLGIAPLALPFTPGPDGAAPVQESRWHAGQGWFEGQVLRSVSAYLAAAGGSFQRASLASRFDADGNLQVVQAHELRLDHHPQSGEALGYRAEGQRTNNLRHTDFAEGWTAALGAPSDSDESWRTVTEPFAPALEVPQIAAGGGIRQPTGSAGGSGRTFASGWIRTDFELRLHGENTSGSSALAIIPQSDGDYALGNGARILARKHGGIWFSHEFGTFDAINFQLRFRTTQPYAPAGSKFILFAPQLEKAGFSSTHIPAGAVHATRLADSLSFARTAQAAGTVLVHARTAHGTDGEQVLWQWDDGTEDNRYRLFRDADGDLRLVVTVAGVNRVDLPVGQAANDSNLSVACSWEAGKFSASLNGSAAVTSLTYAGPLPAVDRLREGNDTAGNGWFGTIGRMALHAAAYPDAELAVMSALPA